MQKSSKEIIEKCEKDANNWKLKLFYFNPEDTRVFVPKRAKSMGITLNFANPKAYLCILLMISFFGFILFMIEKKN